MPEEYITQYGKRLYGLCVRLCGSTSDADDLYQETWLRVCMNFGRYDSGQPFEPWLTAVCVNCFRDRLRRNRFQRLLVSFDDDQERDAVINSVIYDDGSQENAELWEAVGKLPEKYRVMIILHYYRDYDVKQLSRILKIPEGTVKYRLHRARELLKGELSDD